MSSRRLSLLRRDTGHLLTISFSVASFSLIASFLLRLYWTNFYFLFGTASGDIEYIRIGHVLLGFTEPLEYPVGIWTIVHGISLLGAETFEAWLVGNTLVLAPFGLATVILVARLGTKLSTTLKSLILFYVAAPTFIFYSIYNYDLISTLLVILGLTCTIKKWDVSASIAFALGTLVKMLPALLFPLALFWRPRKRWAVMIAVYLLVLVAGNIPLVLLDFSGFIHPFIYQLTRPANPDSLWGVTTQFTGVETTIVPLILTLTLYLYVLRRIWTSDRTLQNMMVAAAAIVMIFVLTNKIYSPQYHLLLIPFLALYLAPSKRNLALFYAIEAVNVFVVLIYASDKFVEHPFCCSLSRAENAIGFLTLITPVLIILRHLALGALCLITLKLAHVQHE